MSGWKLQHFKPSLTNFFFYQHPQTLYDVVQKQTDYLESVQGVQFQFINSSKNFGTQFLLTFDASCAEIWNSEDFVEIATTGRHRGYGTIYIKHRLFHQSILGRDVELQNTHIVLLKSLEMSIKLLY